jgi:hypothetical protein
MTVDYAVVGCVDFDLGNDWPITSADSWSHASRKCVYTDSVVEGFA